MREPAAATWIVMQGHGRVTAESWVIGDILPLSSSSRLSQPDIFFVVGKEVKNKNKIRIKTLAERSHAFKTERVEVVRRKSAGLSHNCPNSVDEFFFSPSRTKKKSVTIRLKYGNKTAELLKHHSRNRGVPKVSR